MRKLKNLLCLCLLAVLLPVFSGCDVPQKAPSIGVSFGVGPAARWPLERDYMVERAKELGVELMVKFNTAEGVPTTQEEDCIALIDSGIDVLILIPRDVNNIAGINNYAKKKGVPIISYARLVLGEDVDIYVGYDSFRIGQMMGQYLSEKVYDGDYIFLKGDPNDYNATLLYDGAMRYLGPMRDSINIILDEAVPGWSVEAAKAMVKKAVAANGNHVDAILAPNDAIAGACAEVLAELNITEPVAITGMDAELSALRRIVCGKQSISFYMSLKELACNGIDQAYNFAIGKPVEINADFDNHNGAKLVKANLINAHLITVENIDRVLIDSGLFTREAIYGGE